MRCGSEVLKRKVGEKGEPARALRSSQRTVITPNPLSLSTPKTANRMYRRETDLGVLLLGAICSFSFPKCLFQQQPLLKT